MFVDSHAHLDGKQFDSDREEVIARAREAGVQTMVAIGNGDGPPTLDAGIQLADKYPFMYATIGIHPHEARLADDAAYRDGATGAASQGHCVGRDRPGLLLRPFSARDAEEVFRGRWSWRRRRNCPSSFTAGRPTTATMPGRIACADRGAMGADRARRHSALLHRELGTGKRALDMGFMISFAGNVTFPKAQQIRDAALEVPLDRMLIETDSPYLAPVPHRGKRNEPAFVKETARKLGELRGLSMEEIGEQTSRNFYNFFKLTETVESKVPPR